MCRQISSHNFWLLFKWYIFPFLFNLVGGGRVAYASSWLPPTTHFPSPLYGLPLESSRLLVSAHLFQFLLLAYLCKACCKIVFPWNEREIFRRFVYILCWWHWKSAMKSFWKRKNPNGKWFFSFCFSVPSEGFHHSTSYPKSLTWSGLYQNITGNTWWAFSGRLFPFSFTFTRWSQCRWAFSSLAETFIKTFVWNRNWEKFSTVFKELKPNKSYCNLLFQDIKTTQLYGTASYAPIYYCWAHSYWRVVLVVVAVVVSTNDTSISSSEWLTRTVRPTVESRLEFVFFLWALNFGAVLQG